MKIKGENIAVIAIIIVITAITASVITGLVIIKTLAPVQQVATTQSESTVATQPVAQSALSDEMTSWQTYKDPKNGIELKYPNGMNIEKALTINVTSENDIRNNIANRIKSDQCPGRSCPDNKSLMDNFSILAKATVCPYEEDFKNEVKESYNLFSVAIDKIEIVDGIMNSNLETCILKTVGVDSYDVNIKNIYYRSTFFNNGNIIRVDFSVLPNGVFAETDAYLTQLGFKDNSCGVECSKNEENVFGDYLNNSLVKKNIATYDKIISTLKFTN
jgi:hypothetical protein